MSVEEKTYPTLEVASCISGVGLVSGITYSRMQEIASALVGFPLWTHELGTGPIMDSVRDRGMELFPDMPTQNLAQDDWEQAAHQASENYGQYVTIPVQETERPADPVSTLRAMRPDAEIVVAMNEVK